MDAAGRHGTATPSTKDDLLIQKLRGGRRQPRQAQPPSVASLTMKKKGTPGENGTGAALTISRSNRQAASVGRGPGQYIFCGREALADVR